MSDPNDKVADVAGRGPDPQTRNGAAPNSAASMLAGTPLGAALGAISSIPREQLLEFVVSGLRSIFAHSPPAYRTKPATNGAPTTGAPTAGAPTAGAPTTGAPTTGLPTSGTPRGGNENGA